MIRKMHTKLSSGNENITDHLGSLGVDGRLILKLMLMKQGLRVWIGFNQFKIWSSSGILLTVTKILVPKKNQSP